MAAEAAPSLYNGGVSNSLMLAGISGDALTKYVGTFVAQYLSNELEG